MIHTMMIHTMIHTMSGTLVGYPEYEPPMSPTLR